MAFDMNHGDEPIIEEKDLTPHSSEAEQALLGALLYDNEVYHRISAIVKAIHFYNPVHARIFDSISMLIEHGKLADAIVLKNRFSQDETLVDIGGVEYLAILLESAPVGAAAPEYAKLIFDLALRRDLIRLGEEIKIAAEDQDSEDDARKQISAAEMQLFSLAETGAVQSGFVGFDKALLQSIEMTTAAFQRDGGLSGMSTGLLDLDRQLGGLHKSDLVILAGRPSMGKTSLAANIALMSPRPMKTKKTKMASKKPSMAALSDFSLWKCRPSNWRHGFSQSNPKSRQTKSAVVTSLKINMMMCVAPPKSSKKCRSILMIRADLRLVHFQPVPAALNVWWD